MSYYLIKSIEANIQHLVPVIDGIHGVAVVGCPDVLDVAEVALSHTEYSDLFTVLIRRKIILKICSTLMNTKKITAIFTLCLVIT